MGYVSRLPTRHLAFGNVTIHEQSDGQGTTTCTMRSLSLQLRSMKQTILLFCYYAHYLDKIGMKGTGSKYH